MLFLKKKITLPLKKKLVLNYQTVTVSLIIPVTQTCTDAVPFPLAQLNEGCRYTACSDATATEHNTQQAVRRSKFENMDPF